MYSRKLRLHSSYISGKRVHSKPKLKAVCNCRSSVPAAVPLPNSASRKGESRSRGIERITGNSSPHFEQTREPSSTSRTDRSWPTHAGQRRVSLSSGSGIGMIKFCFPLHLGEGKGEGSES